MLAVALLAGTVQLDFEGKTDILNGGGNRVFGEDQRAPTEPTAKVAQNRLLAIGDFEQDLDGFQGAFQRDASEAKQGKASAKLENKDKPWIEAGKNFTGLQQDFLELRFWAKSADVKTVTMRLVDKLGHNYQQRFPIDPDGRWHSFIVKEFNKGQAWVVRRTASGSGRRRASRSSSKAMVRCGSTVSKPCWTRSGWLNSSWPDRKS